VLTQEENQIMTDKTKTLDFCDRGLVAAAVKRCVEERASNCRELGDMFTAIGFRTQNGAPISKSAMHIKMRHYGIDPCFPVPDWAEADAKIKKWHKEGRRPPEIVRMLNDRLARPDDRSLRWNDRIVRQRLTAMGLRRCPRCGQLNEALAEEKLPDMTERRNHTGKRTRAEKAADIAEICALIDAFGYTHRPWGERGREDEEDDGDE
jgi:hypothetical protein